MTIILANMENVFGISIKQTHGILRCECEKYLSSDYPSNTKSIVSCSPESIPRKDRLILYLVNKAFELCKLHSI